MRDLGFDFYWQDPFAPNILAKGFKIEPEVKVSGVTALEVFEHTHDPVRIVDEIFNEYDAQFLLFSTVLYGRSVPDPNSWWYYSFDGGQHVTFYSLKTLNYMAEKCNLYVCSNQKNFHVFSKRPLNSLLFRLISSKYFPEYFMNLESKIEKDFYKLATL